MAKDLTKDQAAMAALWRLVDREGFEVYKVEPGDRGRTIVITAVHPAYSRNKPYRTKLMWDGQGWSGKGDIEWLSELEQMALLAKENPSSIFPWKKGWKNVSTVGWSAEVPGYLYQVRKMWSGGFIALCWVRGNNYTKQVWSVGPKSIEEAKEAAEEHYQKLHPLGYLSLTQTKKNPWPSEGPDSKMAERLIRKEHDIRWRGSVRMEKLLGPHLSVKGRHEHDGTGAYLHGNRMLEDLEAMAVMTKANPGPTARVEQELREYLAGLKQRKGWEAVKIGPIQRQVRQGEGVCWIVEVVFRSKKRDAAHRALLMTHSVAQGYWFMHQRRDLSQLEELAVLTKENSGDMGLRAYLERMYPPSAIEGVGRVKAMNPDGQFGLVQAWQAVATVRDQYGVAFRIDLRKAGQHEWRVTHTKVADDLEVLSLVAKENPKMRKLEVYDPREEQLRAQRQAIYETQVLRALGRKGPFRNRQGRRADADLPQVKRAELVRRAMFAMGTSVQKRDRRLYPGTQQFTPKTARESAHRYGEPNKLLRNRQDYEETLGLARKSGFYRVTKEPTRSGLGYFVWPMPPGVHEPVEGTSEAVARQIAAHLNQTEDPRATGKWWRPAVGKMPSVALEHWLPPSEVFSPTFNIVHTRRPSRRSKRKRA